jgi:hypothetical protein
MPHVLRDLKSACLLESNYMGRYRGGHKPWGRKARSIDPRDTTANDENEDGPSEYVFEFNDATVITVDIAAAAIGATVVPVLYRRDRERATIEGTAFCIGASPDSPEALYLTAKHVVECLDPPGNGIEPFVAIPADRMQDAVTTLHPVPITHVVLAGSHSDVALVVANRQGSPTEEIVPQVMTISCAAPVVGQECMALGYPQAPDEQRYMPDEHRYILQGSRGRIEELYADKRDSSFITFPSFRTSGLHLPSMSGGPISTFDGGIIGVVSSGMETDLGPIGYGACVASILELTVNLLDVNGDRRPFRIPDLMAEGYMKRDDADVEMTRTDDGVKLRWL